MSVYLIRHGEAKPEIEDPNRPLTAKGTNEVKKVARYLASLELNIARIHCSDRPRAKQTAEILAEELDSTIRVREETYLSPGADPQSARAIVENASKPIMIAGHLPHLNRLLSLLTIGNSQIETVLFHTGSVVSLLKHDEKWLIDWILTPSILK
jgi:phosphohistidine phosphatase